MEGTKFDLVGTKRCKPLDHNHRPRTADRSRAEPAGLAQQSGLLPEFAVVAGIGWKQRCLQKWKQ